MEINVQGVSSVKLYSETQGQEIEAAQLKILAAHKKKQDEEMAFQKTMQLVYQKHRHSMNASQAYRIAYDHVAANSDLSRAAADQLRYHRSQQVA